jgi:hypothetical protein
LWRAASRRAWRAVARRTAPAAARRAPPHHGEPPFLQPHEALEYIAGVGVARGARPLPRVFLSSVYGGAMLGFSGALVVAICGGAPSLEPGVAKLLAGAIFPTGLAMITLTGTDLLTASFLYCTLPHVVASAAADPGTGGAWRGAYVAQTDGSDALVPPVPSGCKPDAQAGVEREVIADASAATAAGNAKT